MRRIIRRLVPLAAAGMLAGAMVMPASAHVLVVSPQGEGEGTVQWVGGPVGLDANGKGLVLGGPTGDQLMPPSHVKGLNNACETIRANGNGVVDIFGPPTPAGCEHGT